MEVCRRAITFNCSLRCDIGSDSDRDANGKNITIR